MKMDVQTFVQRIGKLPSLPIVYQELVSAIEHPNTSIEDIGHILRKDQSLATRLLRLANSALYGFPSEIATLEEAAQLIGLKEIRDLTLATSVIKAFEGVPPELVDVTAFWKHSIACGIACSLLAEERHDPASERFFVGGLLHDVGRLILFLKAPEQAREVHKRCEDSGELVIRVEMDVLGFEHAALGAELATLWRLPVSLREMVRCHHNPARSTGFGVDAYTVHFADFLTTALEFGNSGEMLLSPLVPQQAGDQRLIEDDRG